MRLRQGASKARVRDRKEPGLTRPRRVRSPKERGKLTTTRTYHHAGAKQVASSTSDATKKLNANHEDIARATTRHH